MKSDCVVLFWGPFGSFSTGLTSVLLLNFPGSVLAVFESLRVIRKCTVWQQGDNKVWEYFSLFILKLQKSYFSCLYFKPWKLSFHIYPAVPLVLIHVWGLMFGSLPPPCHHFVCSYTAEACGILFVLHCEGKLNYAVTSHELDVKQSLRIKTF